MTASICRALLRLAPREFREQLGPAVEETLALRLEEARGAGRGRRARVALRELVGLARAVLAERRRGVGAAPRLSPPGGPGDGLARTLGREAVHALRRLARSPGFTAATVTTLALAIGANAAIFAVVHGVVLNPLPYPESDRLVALDHAAPGLGAPGGVPPSTGLYLWYGREAPSLESLALHWTFELTLTGQGEPERLLAARATPSLTEVLRVGPGLGRWFTEEEGVPGGPDVAVLSYGLWSRVFGGDPGVLGRTIRLSAVEYEVVGVMPASFAFRNPGVQLWLPAQIDEATARASGFNYPGVARMTPGATLDGVRAELDRVIARLPEIFPDDPFARPVVEEARLQSRAVPFKEHIVGSVRGTLWLLLASVGVVLLVACANVANLFLVRAEGRRREVTLRRALGAGRRAVARFFLAESALLALAGGALGVALAWGGVRVLVAAGPADLPRLEEVRLDPTVLAFAAALTGVVAVAFALVPLGRQDPDIARALQEGGRGSTDGPVRQRARQALMGAQVALALVLLVASGLTVRSFQELRAMDLGFQGGDALLFRIGLPSRDYPTPEAMAAAHREILERVAAVPGVRAASAANCLPLADQGYCYGDPVWAEGTPYPTSGRIPPIVAHRVVADGYLGTMGFRVVEGRALEPRDRDERGVVVNEAFVAGYFPGEAGVGRRFSLLRDEADGPEWLTVVGVVANTPTSSLTEPAPVPQLYLLMGAAGLEGLGAGALRYVLRTSGPPADLVPAVRRAVAEVDPQLALAGVETLEDVLARAGAQMAFTMGLLALAAAVALLLGVVGIYGVISYGVSRRTGEIGVRIAMGARPGDVAAMILRQGGMVTAMGLAVGLGGALAMGPLLRAVLFRVDPADPTVLVATAGLLAAVALLACWVPARRAARLDPVEALRAE